MSGVPVFTAQNLNIAIATSDGVKWYEIFKLLILRLSLFSTRLFSRRSAHNVVVCVINDSWRANCHIAILSYNLFGYLKGASSLILFGETTLC